MLVWNFSTCAHLNSNLSHYILTLKMSATYHALIQRNMKMGVGRTEWNSAVDSPERRQYPWTFWATRRSDYGSQMRPTWCQLVWILAPTMFNVLVSSDHLVRCYRRCPRTTREYKLEVTHQKAFTPRVIPLASVMVRKFDWRWNNRTWSFWHAWPLG